MTTGLRTWDSAGNPIIDLTSPVSRIIGSFNTGTSGGSFAVSLPQGTLFYLQSPDGAYGTTGKLAGVTYSGGLFTWSFSYPPDRGFYSGSSTIHYGVY